MKRKHISNFQYDRHEIERALLFQDIKQSFIRAAELGGDVLSIRAADLIQNSYYYHLAPVDMQKQLQDKYVYFMELSDRLLDESLSSELRKAYEKNVKTL